MKSCWKCNREWLEKYNPGLRAECEQCFSFVHCCRNCRFFNDSIKHWCVEPMARNEKPALAKSANRCSYFEFREKEEAVPDECGQKEKSKLSALFADEKYAKKSTATPDWQQFQSPRLTADKIFKPPDSIK